jgi:hypothetical protein
MTQVPPPNIHAMLDENGTPSRPWVAYFQSVFTRIADALARIAALEQSGGGGGGLLDAYEVVTIPPGSGAYELTLEPDFGAAQGVTYDIAMTRDVLLVGISPAGSASGRRITLLIDGKGFPGAFAIDSAVVDSSSGVVGPIPTSAYVGIEGRIRQSGTFFVTSIHARQ